MSAPAGAAAARFVAGCYMWFEAFPFPPYKNQGLERTGKGKILIPSRYSFGRIRENRVALWHLAIIPRSKGEGGLRQIHNCISRRNRPGLVQSRQRPAIAKNAGGGGGGGVKITMLNLAHKKSTNLQIRLHTCLEEPTGWGVGCT